MRGIFYRSDTREPHTADMIFSNGFKKRDLARPLPILRDMGNTSAGTPKAPDVHPSTAVCFTVDFMAAPIFPVSNLNIPSWVYILDLDTTTVYNTQISQFTSVDNSPGKAADEALWPMFGLERCANQISNVDIVGAVQITRSFLGTFAQGGTFNCSHYVPNPNYAGSEAGVVKQQISGLLNEDLRTPTQSQGLVKNTRN